MCNKRTERALRDIRKKLKKHRPEVMFHYEERSDTMKLIFVNLESCKKAVRRCAKTPSSSKFTVYLNSDVNDALIEIDVAPMKGNDDRFTISYFR